MLFVSKKLLAELADVLCRPKFVHALEAVGTTPQQIISVITDVAIRIIPKPLGETVIPNDPSDEAVLACAVTADARMIVSGDIKHLLPLRAYRSIRIMTAKEYLAQVKLMHFTPG